MGWNPNSFAQKFTPWPFPGEALRAEAGIAVVHWRCCCDLNMQTSPLYPNVSHFWRYLANLDLFKVKYSF